MDREPEGPGDGPIDAGDERLDLGGDITCDTDPWDHPDIPDELGGEEPADVIADGSAPERPPLFELIDRQGSPSVSERDKVEPVFDPAPILRSLGVNPGLVEEITTAAVRLRPLGALVLARRPEGEERASCEGRGTYHEDIPVGDTTATIYGKGVGSERSFNQPEGSFTGFPTTPEGLFYDNLATSNHPRVLGAETIRWGIMEAVNAGFVFGQVAAREGWQHLEQAVEAGVTIPLNVLHFRELSAHIGSLLEAYGAEGVHASDRRAFGWEGNRHLGTVTMIVPDSVRISGGIHRDDATVAAIIGRLTSPEVAAVVARTLRTLLDVGGFCFSEDSAHVQNFYPTGLVAQADNSDLVTLGDYRGDAYDGTLPPATPADQRRALLFKQFDRRERTFVPAIAPTFLTDGRVSWEQTVETGVAFWSRMLGGIADSEAIERMVRYMPFMRTELNAAAAELLIESHDAAHWEQIADLKRAVLSQYEPDFGVLSEYEAKVRNNLRDDDPLTLGLPHVIGQDKLRVSSVMQYLRTGNEAYLHTDPILGKAVALLQAIEQVPDLEKRDTILAYCAEVFASKSVIRLEDTPDLVSAFDGQQYELLRNLIENGRLDDAISALQTFRLTSDRSMLGMMYSSEGDGELNCHKFTRLALAGEMPFEELADMAEFEEQSRYLSYIAQTGGYTLGEIIRFRRSDPPQGIPFSLSNKAAAEGYPTPPIVLAATLAHHAVPAPDRTALRDWMFEYIQRSSELRGEDVQPADIARVFDALDAHVARIADRYPELAIMHCSYAAGRFAASNTERAQVYLDRGMDYYRNGLPERAQRAGVDLTAPTADPGGDRANRAAVAARYLRLNLPLVAGHYSKDRLLDPDW